MRKLSSRSAFSRCALLIGCVLTLLAASESALAEAETSTEVFVIPITEVFFDECTVEEVLLTVEVHITRHISTDARGGFHETRHGVVHLTGVGLTSGREYLVVAPNPRQSNVLIGPKDVVEDGGISHFNIITAGPDNNLLGHFTFHATFNANGELVGEVNVEHYSTCEGG